ncbi:MAG: glycogen synthase GlgA [Deltaproteobacteria bacterium]|nr:glycogen synthase GlgA [Deltaproteobacteria bacterium]
MRILFATPEMAPFSRTGGLADVASGLPAALAARGHEIYVITPRYRRIDVATYDLRRKRFRLSLTVKGKTVHGGILEGLSPGGVPVLFVDQPALFEREGIYGQNGKDYPDNDERFAFFCRSVLETCQQMSFSPDVIHCNDWQTGPVAPLLQCEYRDKPEVNKTGTVFTIHDLGFMGLFPPDAMMTLGLSWSLFTPSTMEFFGKTSFIKAGLVFADRLTTVSPTYAQEILTPAYSHGLSGLMAERASDLRGILNGVDYRVWDPRSDPNLTSSYSPDDLAGKTVCKSDLQQHLGLPLMHDHPLVCCTSQMTAQKGIDLFLEAADDMLGLQCQYAFAGRGDPDIERELSRLADRSPHRFAYVKECDEAMVHRLIAGADMVLEPSRHEPSGLAQMQAMRYGAVPVVRATGGLADTVEDASEADEEASGFKFGPASGQAMVAALRRALVCFQDRIRWRRLTKTAMSIEFSWDLAARRYEAVYRQVSALRRPE